MTIFSSPTGVRVQTSIVRNPIPGSESRISYVGLDGAAALYHGYLDYKLNDNALEIHTMTALPHGSGLGSILLYLAALEAVMNCLGRIEALNVAATARGFYLGAGMHPSRASREMVQNMELKRNEFDIKFHLARNAGTWDGMARHVKDNAFKSIENRWT